MNDKVLELHEKRNAHLDAASAILDAADTSGLTDELRKKADENIASAAEIKTSIEQIEADEKRRTLAADRGDTSARKTDHNTTVATPRDADVRVTSPSRPRYGTLRAFKGPNAEENAYRSGQWLAGTAWNNVASREWCRTNGVETRVMHGSSNTAGAYLAPDELSNAIIDLKEEYGVFRQNCTVVPMSGGTLRVPRRTGGTTVYAVGNNLTTGITESSPTVDQIELVAKTWAALTRYDSSLAEDAMISVADMIASEMGYAFAVKEDQSGFIGDATSTYHGVHGVSPKANDGNHAGTLYTAATGNTAFSTLDFADFEGMVGKLPQQAVANAKWYISRIGFYASMVRLADAAGGNTKADVASGNGLQFMGLPVVISQAMNSTTTAQASTAGLAIVGDLRQAATLGDRRGVGISVLTERYADQLQIGIVAFTRSDINVHELGDASVAGSLIVLKTPAN